MKTWVPPFSLAKITWAIVREEVKSSCGKLKAPHSFFVRDERRCMNLRETTIRLVKGLERRSPEILLGIGVGGFVTTVLMGIRATPRALEVLERIEKKSREEESYKTNPKLLKKQITNLAPIYAPTILMGLGSVGCVIGSHVISKRRAAAVASLWAISEAALKEYQEKVVEQLGERKAEKLHQEILQDRLDRDPVEKKEVIVTGAGEVQFYDSYSGRYFKSEIENVRRIQNDLNERLLSEMYISLNDLYFELGLENVEMGDQLGWRIEDGQISLGFSAKLAGGKPTVVLEYKLKPKEL